MDHSNQRSPKLIWLDLKKLHPDLQHLYINDSMSGHSLRFNDGTSMELEEFTLGSETRNLLEEHWKATWGAE